MKNLFKYILASTLMLVYTTSCKEYVEGINISPNSPTDAPTNSIITAAQTNLMGLFEGEDARMAGMWTQQFTGFERQYLSYEEYNVTSEEFSWFQDYIGVAQPCDIAISKLQSVPNTSAAQGMLKVMKAMIFGNLTALYGDIPFVEANNSDFPTPQYDGQASVYAAVQLLLTEAINDLTSGTATISTVDIIGNRSSSNWIKIAHTLKARFYLHTKNYGSAITEAALGLQPGDYGLVGKHGTVNSGNVNLWWDFIEFSRSGYLTAYNAYLPRLLDSDEAVYRGNAKTNETARFGFFYMGDAPGNYLANISDGKMFGKEASYPILTGIENSLILAEAQLSDGSPDEAAALAALNTVRARLASTYPAGVYDPYVLADFDPAGIAGSVGKTRQASLLHEIIEEKYVSLVGQIEPFNDLRRLGNPLGLTPRGASGKFPERFLIPTSEVNANPNTPSPIPELFTPTAVNQ